MVPPHSRAQPARTQPAHTLLAHTHSLRTHSLRTLSLRHTAWVEYWVVLPHNNSSDLCILASFSYSHSIHSHSSATCFTFNPCTLIRRMLCRMRRMLPIHSIHFCSPVVSTQSRRSLRSTATACATQPAQLPPAWRESVDLALFDPHGIWTHWDLHPGSSKCQNDVVQLHSVSMTVNLAWDAT